MISQAPTPGDFFDAFVRVLAFFFALTHVLGYAWSAGKLPTINAIPGVVLVLLSLCPNKFLSRYKWVVIILSTLFIIIIVGVLVPPVLKERAFDVLTIFAVQTFVVLWFCRIALSTRNAP